MCGICGKLSFDRNMTIAPALLKSMADAIHHRGPDDEGYHASGCIGFGFRRLSIIDLNTGHQPLSNEDGTVWIVFNGEIYNYQELREFLVAKGHIFKTQTDTEVIVHLYEECGERCVERLRGMFAFAIWDDRQKSLLLARDRVGIKPLYYALNKTSLTFGSEIKAILMDPEVKAEVAPAMIDRFLSFYYVPGGETLFQNIYKLAPGSYMVVKDGVANTHQYWDLRFAPAEIGSEDAQRKLLALLDESVQLHMISDVPVGFLLSGGIDSTAMLGLAAKKSARQLSSFTLGFSEPGLIDERPYATLAARTYAADHHEMTITSKDFADFLPKFAWYMEEPCCEPQAVALYYVSRLAKEFVKVLISGEGGDEAFAGYQTYRGVLWLERLKSAVGPLRGSFSAALSGIDRFIPSHRLAKYGPLMKPNFEDYYYSRTATPFLYFNSRMSDFYSKDFLAHVDKARSLSAVTRFLSDSDRNGKVNKMLYVDTKTSLPDDLLLKADKMTMANSIELRVPLLDHVLLEFAATLPESFKVRWFTTKYIMKRSLKGFVPNEILYRKKAGFPVPYAAWLRGELRDWTLQILLDPSTVSRGYFNPHSVERLIQQDSETGRYSKEILSLLSLELWHRAFLNRGEFSGQPAAGALVSA